MADDTDQLRRALAAALPGLPEPRDYFSGLAQGALPVPRNLLLFPRLVLKPGNDIAVSHHRFVLVAALGGAGTVVLDERLVPLAEGEALLIHPHQFHSFLDIGRPLRWLFLTGEGVDADQLAPLRDRPVPVPELGWRLLGELVALWRGPARRREARLGLAAGLLLQRLAAEAEARPAAVLPAAARGHRLVERVNRLLHAQPTRAWRIAALARAAGVSASHLRAAFRAAVGTSLGTYLRRARVHHARRLLRESALDLAAIARACGFGSPSAFSRTFRAVTGCSPRTWRAREVEDGLR